jgi:hypothetical protein
MAELLANGADWKNLTPATTLAADGSAVVKLEGAPAGHRPELRLAPADVASVLKGLSKPAPPPSPKLDVGLIGLCGRYTGSNIAQQQAMTAVTGITRDRVDYRAGSTGEATPEYERSLIAEYVKRGAGILPIYDPRLRRSALRARGLGRHAIGERLGRLPDRQR